MDTTVKHNRVAEFYNGRVTIDELKEFSDHRGYLCEFWRTDDFEMNSEYKNRHREPVKNLNQKTNPINDNSPQMCYFSQTVPLAMRGPHEHEDQTDWFITIKSLMSYMFVYKGVPAYFITDPKKIYRIKVEPGVIHSYRNLDLEEVATTSNFPSSLFMGKNKKETIDEIRHEETFHDNKNIYVLGASGRLGSAIVKKLFDDMGFHEYNVIPIYHRFSIEREDDIVDFINHVSDNNVSGEDVIINCIAKTNVQGGGDYDKFEESNYSIPKLLTELSIDKKIHFVHFSTDYVYQTGVLSDYTKSKKRYEEWLENEFQNGINSDVAFVEGCLKFLHVIRLANLFSKSDKDTHNALNKLYNAFEKGNINIVENLTIMPTDVEKIAEFISYSYIHHLSDFLQFINLSGEPHTVEEIFKDFFKIEPNYNYISDPQTVNNPSVFLNRSCYHSLDCDSAIREKISKIVKV